MDAINGEGDNGDDPGGARPYRAQGRAKRLQVCRLEPPQGSKCSTKQPADWDVTKVARIWEALLTKYPKIDAAFFHNDDMALAAYESHAS